jgi:hypothetical protein
MIKAVYYRHSQPKILDYASLKEAKVTLIWGKEYNQLHPLGLYDDQKKILYCYEGLSDYEEEIKEILGIANEDIKERKYFNGTLDQTDQVVINDLEKSENRERTLATRSLANKLIPYDGPRTMTVQGTINCNGLAEVFLMSKPTDILKLDLGKVNVQVRVEEISIEL